MRTYYSAFVLIALGFQLHGQEGPFSGMTPKGLEPGSPAGSYALSGIDTINLYNGTASVNIPLVKIGGRGEAGYTISARASYGWTEFGGFTNCAPAPCPIARIYELGDWSDLEALVRYRPAAVELRATGQASPICPAFLGLSLTRITVKFEDGSEMEFRDKETGGAPSGSAPTNCNDPPFPAPNRGRTWISADGSATTFVTDSDVRDPQYPENTGSNGVAGTLYFRDGRQFRFDVNLPGFDAAITWIQDRNGNRTTFTYPASGATTPCPSDPNPVTFYITDPLGRPTCVTIGKSWTFTSPASGSGSADDIAFQGAGGTWRHITVYRRDYPWDRDEYPTWPTYPQLFNWATDQGNVVGPSISQIVLPDGITSYKFRYTKYGEVARLILPTNGAYEFDWSNVPGTGRDTGCVSSDVPEVALLCKGTGQDPNGFVIAVFRRVTQRREFANGYPGPITRRTLYSSTETHLDSSLGDPLQNSSSPYRCASNYCSRILVTEQDPLQSDQTLAVQEHFFYGSAAQAVFPDFPTWYSRWLEGREFRTDWLTAAGSPPLRKEIQTWEQRVDHPSWWIPGQGDSQQQGPQPPMDARVRFDQQILDSGKMSSRLSIFSSDPNDNTNNPIDVYENDYGLTNGSTGPLIRHTHVDYVTSTGYTNVPTANPAGVHLRSLPSYQSVDSGSSPVAQTQYIYDAGGSPRGNVTTLSRWRNTDGAWLNTVTGYDAFGNPTSVQNPRGYTSSVTYTCSNAFPYQLTNAKSQITTYNYSDCFLGKPNSVTDSNSATTAASYNDSLDRLTHIALPDGSTTDYQYSPDLKTQTVLKDLDSGRRLTTSSTTDGLGRGIQAVDAAGVTSTKTFDALGRVSKAFNPGDSVNGTSYTYDFLGRVASVTYADGSLETFKSYDVNSVPLGIDSVEHKDPAGKYSRQRTDAAGRIAAVNEDPYVQNFSTAYYYDALDDLVTVAQGSQTRTFVYDSLAELRSAANPENATISYTYDNNGNLFQKTDPGVTTTLGYDQLDRVLSKTYSDGTPNVSYTYDHDGGGDRNGCLSSVSSSISATTFTLHDPLCRVKTSTQSTAGQTYPSFQYAYNLAGLLTNETYPSGRLITAAYDNAGRPLSLSGSLGGTTTYASAVQYEASGAMRSMTLGTSSSLVEQHCYNNRLQVTAIRVASSTASNCANPGTDLINLALSFTSGQNNGNVQSQTIQYQSATESFQSLTQSYTSYDALNRLTGFSENSKIQTYGYDQYGNRWRSATDAAYPNDINTPTQQSHYDPTKNRITLASVGYDTAGRGNVTQLNPFTLAYDGENHQKSMVSVNSNAASYDYDGDGRRVRKMTCDGNSPCTTGSSNLKTTVYVYDAFGQLAVEYPTVAPSAGREFLIADHLGSTRLILDAAGAVKLRYDYLPFGEGLGAGVNGRSAKYSVGAIPALSDGESMKFTGQERDAETGLDFFSTRYLNAALGRFTGTDLPFADQDEHDPQSWNLYGYARNSPLTYTDKEGRSVTLCGPQGCGSPISDSEYQQLSEHGISLPSLHIGDPHYEVDSGPILCGGLICGSATYTRDQSSGMRLDAENLFNVATTIMPAAKGALGAAKAGVIIAGVVGSAAERSVPRLTQEALEHIVIRHWATSGAAGAGKFSAGTTARGLRQMIEEALEGGISRANTQGRLGTIVERDFGRQIGTDVSGVPATRLRIVLNPDNTVKTAFPIK